MLVFLVIFLWKIDRFLSGHPTEILSFFSVSFFFLLLTTSPWWALQSMLPVTDLVFIPANWTSSDSPNFDSSPMLPSDFDLLHSRSILPFHVISGISNWFNSSFPSVSFNANTSMCRPSNLSLMDRFRTNSTRFSTLYYFITAVRFNDI